MGVERSGYSAGLRVIGAGFGRTGTMSLKAALEQLGFGPSYHMIENFDRPDRAAFWLDAAEGKPVDWRGFLSGYRATVDWPGCAFYRQLMDAFPKAKVLLSTRDPERWYESVSETIHSRPSAEPPGDDDPVNVRMIRKVVWEGSLQGRFNDRDEAIDIFKRHNAEVQESVPAERLLVYEVKEGWEPLCRFLDVPVPNEPFPHLNDRTTFNDPDSFREMVAEYQSPVA